MQPEPEQEPLEQVTINAMESTEIRPISHQSTNALVFELVKPAIRNKSLIADVGAGEGFFSQLVGQYAEREMQIAPHEVIAPSDLFPEFFRYEAVKCAAIAHDGILPYDDDSVDVACSLEVVEHLEDQFAFARELHRIVKPGGTAIISTPNVLNLNSRWRNLHSGFAVLFDPLLLSSNDPVHTSGHIHPVSYYYLAYQLRRAGFVETKVRYDRFKTSARMLSVVLAPFIYIGNFLLRRRLAHRKPDVVRENIAILDDLWSFGMMTSRSVVVIATKGTNARKG
jgi:SAM-dependent methyltransferase